jgi:hypothetical protein
MLIFLAFAVGTAVAGLMWWSIVKRDAQDEVLLPRPLTTPGWYPSPVGAPLQRFYDGMQWTVHIQRPAPDLRGQAASGL